jgi:hypothetical protein
MYLPDAGPTTLRTKWQGISDAARSLAAELKSDAALVCVGGDWEGRRADLLRFAGDGCWIRCGPWPPGEAALDETFSVDDMPPDVMILGETMMLEWRGVPWAPLWAPFTTGDMGMGGPIESAVIEQMSHQSAFSTSSVCSLRMHGCSLTSAHVPVVAPQARARAPRHDPPLLILGKFAVVPVVVQCREP